MRTGTEVRGGLVAAGTPGRAGDDDLAGHRVPGEEQGDVRVLRQLPGLAGVVVRVEDETLLVVLLEQHRARTGPPLGVRRGDDHRVRLVHRAVHGGLRGLLEPTGELVHGMRGQIGLDEPLGAIVGTHRGGSDGEFFGGAPGPSSAAACAARWTRGSAADSSGKRSVTRSSCRNTAPTRRGGLHHCVALSAAHSPQRWHSEISCCCRPVGVTAARTGHHRDDVPDRESMSRPWNRTSTRPRP